MLTLCLPGPLIFASPPQIGHLAAAAAAAGPSRVVAQADAAGSSEHLDGDIQDFIWLRPNRVIPKVHHSPVASKHTEAVKYTWLRNRFVMVIGGQAAQDPEVLDLVESDAALFARGKPGGSPIKIAIRRHGGNAQ